MLLVETLLPVFSLLPADKDDETAVKETSYILYECNLCGDIFIFPDDIERHMKHHSMENWPLFCAYCGYGDRTVAEVAQHCRQMHGGN